MTTLTSASLSQEHQQHRASMVGPLTVSCGLGLAVTCIVIATLAVVVDPKIQLSHYRDGVTLWLQGLNTHTVVSQ